MVDARAENIFIEWMSASLFYYLAHNINHFSFSPPTRLLISPTLRTIVLFIFYLSVIWTGQRWTQKLAFISLKFQSFNSFTPRSASIKVDFLFCFHLLFSPTKAADGGRMSLASEAYSPPPPPSLGHTDWVQMQCALSLGVSNSHVNSLLSFSSLVPWPLPTRSSQWFPPELGP